MKPLSEQDHYETLEIPQNASAADVERAYLLARATYSEGSLAGHSVFEEGDVEVIRERIEIAYHTLRDPELRESYDAELDAAGDAQEPAPIASDPLTLATSVAPPGEEDAPVEPLPSIETLELEELDAQDEGEFDGARLRRARLRNGVELEAIAGVTKVNPTYLRFIEEERFEDLPAAVYVRGFVMGYASCVGLDPKRVAQSYMPRYEASRSARPARGRFSRR
ncbi:MAG: helix-turn-helix domain-containing protein [Myxococcota bacterium]